MTTELEALRRVAEAAQILAESCGVIRGKTPEDDDIWTVEIDHVRELNAALDALPAPVTEPEGGVVEVVAAVRIVDGGLPWVHHSEQRPDGSWDIGPPGYIATIRARVPLPRVPEVVGEVG